MPPPVPVADLARELRALGVARDDVLMIHASLRRIGPVAGGASGVIRALELAVGRRGSLLMGLGARDDWAWVNHRPEVEREGLLAGSVPFDFTQTPADPDMGVLAEVFRRSPGTVVNDHPEGRFGARGRLAHQLVDDPPWDDYYGPGSPLERLHATGGKVLRLGADPETVTLLHYAEYLAPVPHKRRVVRHRLVAGVAGPAVRTVSSLDDSDGIVDHPGEDYFGTILRAYLATGRAKHGPVGGAQSELLDGRDLVAFAAGWMGEHLRGDAGDPRAG